MTSTFGSKIKRGLLSIRGFRLSAIPLDFATLFLLTLLISTLLIRNIYASLNDLNKYQILEQENEVLAVLEQENDNLQKQKDYYDSPFFAKLYARKKGMVEEHQTPFEVVRERDLDYSDIPPTLEYIDTHNTRLWWYKLIL